MEGTCAEFGKPDHGILKEEDVNGIGGVILIEELMEKISNARIKVALGLQEVMNKEVPIVVTLFSSSYSAHFLAITCLGLLHWPTGIGTQYYFTIGLGTSLSKGEGSVPHGKKSGKLEEIAWDGHKRIVTALKYGWVSCLPQLVTTQESNINFPVINFVEYEEMEIDGFVVEEKSAVLISIAIFNLLGGVGCLFEFFDSPLTCVDVRQYETSILADLEDEYLEEVTEELEFDEIEGSGYSWGRDVFWKNLFWLFSVTIECMTILISTIKLEDKLVLWGMVCYDQVLALRKREATTPFRKSDQELKYAVVLLRGWLWHQTMSFPLHRTSSPTLSHKSKAEAPFQEL